MERWNIIPSEWDQLSQYDKAFMMEFVNAEADIASASSTYDSKKNSFIVGLGVDENG